MEGQAVSELIERIACETGANALGQMVHVEQLAAREAEYAIPSPPLPTPIQRALNLLGVEQLYSHQVESLERARRGENIVVVTATSSGKTLCYNLPILETILADRDARAIYLYPINALINDQFKTLFKLNLALGQEAIGIARYTGALSSDKRKAARERHPHIWLTNPEMLHLSFLLWHQNWEELWRNLRYIVIDEVHTYRGVFGSNMAQLLRRMLRMADHYGSNPQFICCSATIANPQELAETLTGRPFSVIDRNGAGSGRKFFVLWNPPLEGENDANLRRSYTQEAVDLLLRCVRANYNTIVFARARGLTERMLRLSRDQAQERGEADLLDKISSYRAGYLAEEREAIEGKLKTGEIQGIITTNALEMGIDIGGLDAAIISGYPGTIMSTWQQAGRAGRRGRDALVVLVASQNPLDQYYVNHPREFFGAPHELAVVDLNNQYVRLKHLLCAARELPLAPVELARMSDDERELIQELCSLGLLAPVETEAASASGGAKTDAPSEPGSLTYPKTCRDIHLRISLRAASHETYKIIDEEQNEIGAIEPPNVYREAHPGAIYQHAGDDYRVIFLDRHQKLVKVRKEQAPHYTRASSNSRIKIERILETRELQLGGLTYTINLGDALVEETIHSYQELRLGSDELVKRVNLTMPLTLRLHTTAMWVAIPPDIERDVVAAVPPAEETKAAEGDPNRSSFAEGLHAVQHLLTGVMPLLVMCDRRDIDGHFQPNHPDVGAAAVFVYDAYEGGIGLAEIAYERAEELLRLAHDTVTRCGCHSGCPSCVQSGACRMHNELLNKAAARMILAKLTMQTTLTSPPVPFHDAPSAHYMERGCVHPSPCTHREGERPLGALQGERSDRHTLSRQLALQDLVAQVRRQGLVAREEAAPPAEPQYAAGETVEHTLYGRGQVLATRQEGRKEVVTVQFRRHDLIKEFDVSQGSLRKL